MSNNVNKVTLIGRLTRDPEAKQVGENALSSFSVATSYSWKDKSGEKQEKTEFTNCTAWGKLADICNQYLKKGKLVYIEGRLQTDKYDKEGQTHYNTKVVVNDMKMLSSKAEDGGTTSEPVAAASKPAATSAAAEEIDLEDIPF